jgi:hypothetical protein
MYAPAADSSPEVIGHRKSLHEVAAGAASASVTGRSCSPSPSSLDGTREGSDDLDQWVQIALVAGSLGTVDRDQAAKQGIADRRCAKVLVA